MVRNIVGIIIKIPFVTRPEVFLETPDREEVDFVSVGKNSKEILIEPIDRTIELAAQNVERGGRPFSCLVVSSETGELLAESPNLVVQTSDPTAHAEVVAIRIACQRLGKPSLEGYEVYVMAHPCPMCLAALYYASPDRVVYIVTREEEGRYYKDDQKYFEFENFYEEFGKSPQQRRLPMEHKPVEGGPEVYRRWLQLNSNGIT